MQEATGPQSGTRAKLSAKSSAKGFVGSIRTGREGRVVVGLGDGCLQCATALT